VFGNNWDWVPDPTTPQPELAVTLRDASGEHHRLVLGRVNWKFWGLLHKLILPPDQPDPGHFWWGGDGNGRLDAPLVFTGIEARNLGNREPRKLYFDSAAFYYEPLPVVHYQPRPSKLPFPTSPDTILPSLSQPVRNEVVADAGGRAFRFVCAGDGAPLEYRYVPRTGTVPDRPGWRAGKRLGRPTPEWSGRWYRLRPPATWCGPRGG
jgi:hypothetical protein